jgi:hypothetical protein
MLPVNSQFRIVAPLLQKSSHTAMVVAATACDLVVNQITHNDRGLPAHPKVILIESAWIEGETLPDRRSTGIA